MDKIPANPKVSVIIPVYNMERFLPDAVNSALGQSFQDFEIIIADDGSTDSTLNVANRFARKDKRVIVLRQEHKGTYPARNLALRHAKGEYIAMLDADDIWEKSHLKDSVEFLDKNPDIALVFSRRKDFAETPEMEGKARCLNSLYEENIGYLLKNEKTSRKGKFVKFESPVLRSILKRYPITNSTKVMRKGAVVGAGMYANIVSGGDAELAFRLVRNNNIGFIDKAGAIYRVHSSNLHSAAERSEAVKLWDIVGKYGSLSRQEKWEIRLKKADALRCAGYECFERDNFRRARELFSRSLKLKKSCFALKYLAIMAVVPESILRFYRENRRFLRTVKKPASIPLKHEKPFVSVVVPALNSEKTICKCLGSLQEQDYPKKRYEIIVVDNGSRDSTVEIAKSFKARLYRKPKLSVSGLRNFGAKKAKSEIIAFADSDCVVGSGWLRNAVNVLSNPEAACTGCMYSSEGRTWVARAWQLSLERKSRDSRLIPGGNIIVKRKAFEDIGGFDSKLGSGEDQDFCFRLVEGNYAIVPDKRLRSIHLREQSTLSGFFARQFSYGRWGIAFMKKHLMGLPASTAAKFGIYTLFAAAGTIFGIAAFILLGWKIPLILFAGLFAFPPLLMSISVSLESGRIRHAHHLFALYSACGAARALALLFQKSSK